VAYALDGLKDKVAVITGAGRMRSIGRAIALELARNGCDVVLTGTGRSPDRYPEDERAAGWRDVDSVADEVAALGRRSLAVVSDVARRDHVVQLRDDVLATMGRVDVVVNNASMERGGDRRPVVDLDADTWRRVMDVNLTGTFLMCQVFGRALLDQGQGGSIVNISSIAGKIFSPETSAYAASKAGVQALTACMAREVGPAGIRVNALCPGLVDTSRMDSLGRGADWDAFVATIPLRRAGLGADIAWLTAYLCSDQGSFITGQSWNVDGGTVVQH
jgi:3-oxoacyl-[acyl-carrier protein] reductase